jgi:acyl-coenzyme A synthetase/AMP-(fatty) acid ligase
MNSFVVFAGFGATSLATRIVDAQAKLVIMGMQRCAQANSFEPSWEESTWAIVRCSEYHFFEGKMDQLYTENQKV